MVKYTCLLLPTQPCHSYHYGQFTHRQEKLIAIIRREIFELLVWSFLPFTGWVLTELGNTKCFTKPFSCHWFLLAFMADGPIFSLKRLTARGLMQKEGSARCSFSLPEQWLLLSPRSWRHVSSRSENIPTWPLPTHKHSLSELKTLVTFQTYMQDCPFEEKHVFFHWLTFLSVFGTFTA